MNITKTSRIAVLLGGFSKEREISLKTGKAIAKALRNRGYLQVKEILVDRQIAQHLLSEAIEVAVIALHGRNGEDGTIQGLLECLQIPYTGSGVMGSAIAMDKITSKHLFRENHIPTPPWMEAKAGDSAMNLAEEVEKKLGFPVIAKPPSEGSTFGLSLVRSKEEVQKTQNQTLAFGSTVLWEKWIQGTELTVAFLGGQTLPVVEIVPPQGLFDFEAKYTQGKTQYFCPARISEEVAQKAQEVALRAFQAVHAESFGRVDLLWSQHQPWVLEVNTIPGMTETSLLPKAAAVVGKSFEDVAEEILLDARLKVEGLS